MINFLGAALAAAYFVLHMLCINPKHLLALSFIIFACFGNFHSSVNFVLYKVAGQEIIEEHLLFG